MLKRIIYSCLGLSLLFIGSIAYFSYDLYRFSQSTLTINQPTVYYFQPGTSVHRMSQQLFDQRYIHKPNYLRWLIRLKGISTSLQAGEYELYPGLTVNELLTDMQYGNIKLRSITFIEGWTFAELLNHIQQTNTISQTLSHLPPAQIMAQLGNADRHPEGQFFPDTYAYARGATDKAILHTALKQMEKQLNQAWQQRQANLPYQTPEELLIVASIIEKEANLHHERPIVAGVIVNRLNKKMRLQVDPTVIYGLGDQYQGRLTRQDLLTDTPYNTYMHRGLTPTPIAMPSQIGRASCRERV